MHENRVLMAGAAILVIIGLGAALFPGTVYDQFIWKHFWGPIVADAGTGTAVHNGVTAHAGYTLTSEIGYGLILGYLLLLLVTVLKRLDVGTERNFVVFFVPFVVSGGLLRVLEDVPMTTGLVGPPLQYLLISPLIYFTMFGIVFFVLLISIVLEGGGFLRDYRHGIAAGGVFFAGVVNVALLLTGNVARAWMLPASLGLASAVFGAYYGTYRVFDVSQLKPVFDWEGGSVLFGHLLDGSSTALSISLLGYGEKHPVVEFFITTTGNAYAFILLKLAILSFILVYMTDEMRQDDPLFFNLILLGILAVGLGPGIRNMTRAILGV